LYQRETTNKTTVKLNCVHLYTIKFDFCFVGGFPLVQLYTIKFNFCFVGCFPLVQLYTIKFDFCFVGLVLLFILPIKMIATI
jgi:hypothetical protein